MLPWKTVIQINKASNRPVYLQIADQLIKEINAGRIKPGMKMPGSRAMAAILNVNRKTVIQAYDELNAQGWITVASSSGSFVSQHLPITSIETHKTSQATLKTPVGPKINTFDYIDDGIEIPPQVIYVNGGSPDPRLAPYDWLLKEARSQADMRNGHKLLHYASPEGDIHFREVLAKYLAESRGLNVQAQNILITRGSQMGIFISASGLIEKGKRVIVGDSSYDAAEWAFQYHHGQIIRVPIDHEGLDTEYLEQLCKSKPIHLVYVTPHHHFPTTVTMSSQRRMRLLELAQQYDFYILEDDYDYDIHYKSAPLLPLASLNHHRVLYVGSFSKIIAPSFRIGYLIAPPGIINEFSKISRVIDRQGDHLMQRALAEAIKSGELNRHLKKSLKLYRERRDFLAQLLENKLRANIAFEIPEGGMAFWLRFKRHSVLELKPFFEKHGLYLDIDRDLAKKYNAFRFGFASFQRKETEQIVEIMQKVFESQKNS